VAAKNFNKLNDNIFRDDGINLIIKIKVLESYIIHADPDVLPGYIRNNILVDIGRIERMVRRALKNKYNLPVFIEGVPGPDPGPLINADPENENNYETLLQMAGDIFESLPDLDFFQNLSLSCDDDLFFEALISIVRTTALSLQSDLNKSKNNYRAVIGNRLHE
jgi:hypothetical protein